MDENTQNNRQEWSERPFGQYFRTLCNKKSLKTGQLAAKAAGLGVDNLAKSTIDDLFSGRTWAPTAASIAALIEVLNLDEEESNALREASNKGLDARVMARRQSNEPALSTSSPEIDDAGQSVSPSAQTPLLKLAAIRRDRPKTAAGILCVLVAVLALVVFFIVRLSDQAPSNPVPPSPSSVPTSVSGTSTSPSSCGPPAPPNRSIPPARSDDLWPTMVVNTWSITQCRDIGTLPHPSPFSGGGTTPGFHTGAILFTDCYTSKGREVVDKDSGIRSTTWFHLDKGRWISSNFLKFDEVATDGELPPGMPACKKK